MPKTRSKRTARPRSRARARSVDPRLKDYVAEREAAQLVRIDASMELRRRRPVQTDCDNEYEVLDR